MHELSIASAVAEKVMAFAQARQPARVLQVRLAVGEMTCLQKEQLAFCYHAITQATPIEDSTLEIEPVAPESADGETQAAEASEEAAEASETPI